jgi:hypothetical protein
MADATDDLAPVYDALRNASAKGDTANANKLADYLKSKTSAAPAAPSGAGAEAQTGIGGTAEPPDHSFAHGALEGAAQATNLTNPMSGPARLVGAGENVLSQAGGMAGHIADTLTGSDPGAHDWSYKPQTAAGKDMQQDAGTLATGAGRLAMKAIGPAVKAAGGDPEAARDTLAERVPQALDSIAPFTAGLGSAGIAGAAGEFSEAARGSIPKAPAPAIAVKLQDAGYQIRPSDLARMNPAAANRGDIPGTTRESLSPPDVGKIQSANAANTNRLATADKNIPNAEHMTPDDFNAAKGIGADGQVKPLMSQVIPGAEATETPLHVYQRAAAGVTKGAKMSDGMNSDFDQVAATTQASDPNIIAQIGKIVEAYRSKYATQGLDGQGMLNDISTLRQRAKVDMQNQNLDFQDRGMAYRGVADAIEKEMGRQFPPDSSLGHDFPIARTDLAQIHDVEASTRAGSVDPAVMKSLRDKGAPLSGNNALIADAAEHLPNTAIHPDRIAAPSETNETVHHGISAATMVAAKGAIGHIGGSAMESAAQYIRQAPRPAATPNPGMELAPPPAAPTTPTQGKIPMPAGRSLKDLNPAPFELTAPEGPVIEPAQRGLTSPADRTNTREPMARADWDQSALKALKRRGENR